MASDAEINYEGTLTIYCNRLSVTAILSCLSLHINHTILNNSM